jgi:hypothetical protein
MMRRDASHGVLWGTFDAVEAAELVVMLRHGIERTRRDGRRPPAWVFELVNELETLWASERRAGALRRSVAELEARTSGSGGTAREQARGNGGSRTAEPIANMVPISTAAAELGITTRQVRNRVRAGSLAGKKDQRGHYRVLLPIGAPR